MMIDSLFVIFVLGKDEEIGVLLLGSIKENGTCLNL